MLLYELLGITRALCRTVNHYNLTSVLVFHGTVWCHRIPGLMNHFHAYSYLWQTLLPSISYSIWSPGLSCGVSDISHLDFCGGYEEHCPSAKMADKRRNLGTKREVSWVYKGKVNYQKGNKPNCATELWKLWWTGSS